MKKQKSLKQKSPTNEKRFTANDMIGFADWCGYGTHPQNCSVIELFSIWMNGKDGDSELAIYFRNIIQESNIHIKELYSNDN